jgi:putative sugar O-methyltransferase
MKKLEQPSRAGGFIPEDQDLLSLIIQGAVSSPSIYSPGEYWKPKIKSAVAELRKQGLNNFRSGENSAATSYGDNPCLNIINTLSNSRKHALKKFLVSIYPFKNLFESQVRLTKLHFKAEIEALNAYFSIHHRVNDLFERYNVNFDTTTGGDESILDYKGQRISHVYLKLLDTMDYINSSVNLKNIRSFIEIGGGFGVNVDLMLQNFSNIRKILYVDIAPNLYVGTQYLKSKYGSSVLDYRLLKTFDTINFKNDDSLEIFCILPAQMEKVEAKFDLFHNAHSFVEMSLDSVTNYGKLIKTLLNEKGRVYLVTYDGFDELTIRPEELSNLLSIPLSISSKPTLISNRFDYHLS